MEEKYGISSGKILLFVLIIAIITSFIFIVTPVNKVQIVSKKIEVTAHRGLSAYYPENTMEAFQKAHEAGADWIELDVQETKDGVVVVTHYPNLHKLANVNKYVYKLTYKELKEINVGAYLKKVAYIPTLEEVIIWAKDNNVKLNIELKETGHEKQLIKSTIDIVNKYNYRGSVLIASQSYEFLKGAKECDSNMTTVYIGRKLEQDVDYYVYADIFSIKKTELTKDLVEKMHEINKKVFVWTILNAEELQEMIDYNVDNVIANDVKMVKDYLDNI